MKITRYYLFGIPIIKTMMVSTDIHYTSFSVYFLGIKVFQNIIGDVKISIEVKDK